MIPFKFKLVLIPDYFRELQYWLRCLVQVIKGNHVVATQLGREENV